MASDQTALKRTNLPAHVALIMDGNRRWAKAKGLSPLKGHAAGEERIEPIVDRAIALGISYLTFWAFSTENWNRTKREVQFLLRLYRENLAKTVERFHQKNVRIRVIGNLSMFPGDIRRQTDAWVEKTRGNSKVVVNMAMSYGGRDELVRAVRRVVEDVQRSKLAVGKLSTESFSQYLDTVGQPDPDFLIRTGGELRLSGFLSWQIAYSELYFTKVYWPDFTVREFDKALAEFQRRQRRFGK